jgi:hypothetical protein
MNIHVDDENDHSPKFEQSAYTFYTDEYPYNNTEIGRVELIFKKKWMRRIIGSTRVSQNC